MRWAVDTETTGLYPWKGDRPFFVSLCDQEGNQCYWEWDVIPETRKVIIPEEDRQDIQKIFDDAHQLIFHNACFDILMLESIGITIDWKKVDDTLVASHLLSSSLPHDLTSLAIYYLASDISSYERELLNQVRRVMFDLRRRDVNWNFGNGISEENYWILAAHEKSFGQEIGNYEFLSGSRALVEYANTDTLTTMQLWEIFQSEIARSDLWEYYETRKKLLPIITQMTRRGVSLSEEELITKKQELDLRYQNHSNQCIEIAQKYQYDLQLPKTSRNRSLDEFVFRVLGYEPIGYSKKTGNPLLNAEIMEEYRARSRPGSSQEKFFDSFLKRSESAKGLVMLDSYQELMVYDDKKIPRLHSSYNIAGTVTTRWSSRNPNIQNISKLSEVNFRSIFGPAPGRVWYSIDAENIELRIPAYEAEEKELIEVFDHPERGPYYGSFHLVVFDTLHPEKFREHGKAVKTIYEDTYYQWVKNGNFARQYGAQEETVDRTYRVKGGYRKVCNRFPKIDQLNRCLQEFAQRHGYVETIPDRNFRTRRGYPLWTQKTANQYGVTISPTLPLCYHVSGSAGWWMTLATIAVHDVLTEWNQKTNSDACIIIQVHDELVLDFPEERFENEHSSIIERIRQVMQQCGDRIGVPTPVVIERHRVSWKSGEIIPSLKKSLLSNNSE